MNTNKIALMAIAVVAIGIFALPSTVSLFSGQHSWYDLGATGNDVPCLKCHGDIYDEMVATSPKNGVHRGMNKSCECHRVSGTGVAIGDTDGSTPGTTSHAAETIACMICHENATRTGKPLEYPFAGGFNTTWVYDFTGAPTGDDRYNYSWGDDKGGEYAAHNDFIRESIKDPLMTDSNEACIACHTRIGVNITWRKSTTMHFDASEDHNGTWLLSNFTAHGYDYYNSTYQNNWTNSY
jgi:hypothetical protein